jgi:signal transduction histidine kinase
MSILVIALLLFAVPLAIAAQRFYESQAVVSLDRRAAEAAAEIAVPPSARALAAQFGSPSHRRPSIYDLRGRRIYGRGPRRADAAVRAALAGSLTDATTSGRLVVAAPVTDKHERVTGAVRVVEPTATVAEPVHRAWATMAALAIIVLVVGWFAARRQARRIGRPVDALVDAATALGDGDFSVRSEASGIPELDTLGAAFDRTAGRIGTMLERERSFSADASHQLRTPLAGLRLRLENAERNPAGATRATLRESIGDVERLEATIDHLLTLARDVPSDRGALDVDGVLEEARRTWAPALERDGRELTIRSAAGLLPVDASRAAVSHVLDALVDNALTHGAGTVHLSVRPAPGGVAIEVTDDGAGVSEADRGGIFDRRQGTGTGIGLSLARSLAEAEGGRLVLGSAQPPTFTLVLPGHLPESSSSDRGTAPAPA